MADQSQFSAAALTLSLGPANSTASTSNLVPQDQEPSTALTLCDPSWNWNFPNKEKAEESHPVPHKLVPPTPKTTKESGKNYSKKYLNRAGSKTTPGLEPREPWTIKKRLKVSDLGSLSRLLMPKDAVIEHVLRYLDDKLAKRVESKEGLRVVVQDCDTNSKYLLSFKYWETIQSYVLNGNWRQAFVHRRSLKENDQIGMYWDTSKSMFMFSLLEKASEPQLPA